MPLHITEDYVTAITLSGSGTVTWDLNDGHVAKMYPVSGDVTVQLSNLDEGPDGVLYFKQDDVGGHLITLEHTGLSAIGDISTTADMVSGDRGVLSFARADTDLYQTLNTNFND